MEVSKFVVCPKGPATGPKGKIAYRYMAVGLVVSDQPVPELERINADGQSVLVWEGESSIISELLRLQGRDPNFRVGDASAMLTSLKDL